MTGGRGHVLDLLAGHGYLSAELAQLCPDCIISCTGLGNDLDSFQALRESELYTTSVWKNIRYTECDVTSLPFEDDTFDYVMNFLGLEDVMMTNGEDGLLSVFSEVSRVSKQTAIVELSIVEYGASPEEMIAEEIWASIGLNAIFLPKNFYIKGMAEHEFRLTNEVVYQLRKKMTLDQAKEELKFACEQAPEIFKQYDITAVSFDELMSRFGKRIAQHGMAFYPNIRILLFAK